MFHRVRDVKIYERVLAQIKDLIEQGAVGIGDRLPSEPELARQLGVSRSSIREALRVLEILGIVTRTPGRGTIISSAFTNMDLGAAGELPLGDLSDALWAHLLEAREVIEPAIARIAAEKASDGDIRKLERILAEMERQIDEGGSGLEADVEFHLQISRMTRNPIFVRMMHSFVDLLKQGVFIQMEAEQAKSVSLERHRAILEALRRRDAAAAEGLLAEHLQRLRDVRSRTGRREGLVMGR